jgi:hypothetical protein
MTWRRPCLHCKNKLLAAAVAIFLATRLQDERLGLLTAVILLARASVATLLGFAGFLTVGHAVESANLPRGELHHPGLFTDRSLHDGSRRGGGGLNGSRLENADCAVGRGGRIRIRGGDGNGNYEGGKNTSHQKNLLLFGRRTIRRTT